MTAGAVKNYQAIDAPYTGAKWAGLERSTTTGVALIDGSVGTTWWWYAVGTSRAHNHHGKLAIPGPAEGNNYWVVDQTELYVKTYPQVMPLPAPVKTGW